MTVRSLDTIIAVLKGLAFCVFFACFIMLVQPHIASAIVPSIVRATNEYKLSQKGIDLDPIYLSHRSVNPSGSVDLYVLEYGNTDDGMYGELVTSDTRVMAMNAFLVDYHSPMAPYAATFVETADETGLDWRLVASISGVESAFGLLIPRGSYNGWGWRGGPGGDFSNFGSWENGIQHVTRRIAEGYGTHMSVYDMEPIYCPPCGMNPNHEWANGVAGYMNQLSIYRDTL